MAALGYDSALVLADAVLEKFGGDAVEETRPGMFGPVLVRKEAMGVVGALLWIAAMSVVAANESRRRGAGLPRAFSAALLGIEEDALQRAWTRWMKAKPE